jgi:hypothetical protein
MVILMNMKRGVKVIPIHHIWLDFKAFKEMINIESGN